MTYIRERHVSGGIDNALVVFGGNGGVPMWESEIFTETSFDYVAPTLTSPHWEEFTGMPMVPGSGSTNRFDHASASHGTKLFVFGGAQLTPAGTVVVSTSIASLDMTTDLWTTLPAVLPKALRGARAITVGDKIYVLGGNTGTSTSKSCYVFDPIVGSIAPMEELKTPRTSGMVGYNAGKLWYLGGADSLSLATSVKFHDTIESLDLLTPGAKWTDSATKMFSSSGTAAGLAHAGFAHVFEKIYIFGGAFKTPTSSSVVYSDRMLVFDMATASWTQGPNMPLPHYYASATYMNGELHVLGGLGGTEAPAILSAHNTFDPVTGAWNYDVPDVSPDYIGGVYMGAAASFGSALVVSGGVGDGVVRSDVWEYTTD
jgi:hypothetical protein